MRYTEMVPMLKWMSNRAGGQLSPLDFSHESIPWMYVRSAHVEALVDFRRRGTDARVALLDRFNRGER
jgi:hypothetical protein